MVKAGHFVRQIIKSAVFSYGSAILYHRDGIFAKEFLACVLIYGLTMPYIEIKPRALVYEKNLMRKNGFVSCRGKVFAWFKIFSSGTNFDIQKEKTSIASAVNVLNPEYRLMVLSMKINAKSPINQTMPRLPYSVFAVIGAPGIFG